ncbi:MAG: hypothetical protein CVT80_11645 [Alphaproteobacteria bacterium HGW-Alphaproteobacteria-2]|nr:MAG: hypothetical protein CVT80_11645 [Alphaproteobacteria bacterium HGW-Alphaproteobacteria-2]
MHLSLNLVGLVLAVGLSACSSFTPPSRSTRGEIVLPRAPASVAMRDWQVVGIRVTVPETLKISEANSYYPVADIVWRGDPPGDRRAQIADLLRGALAEGTRQMQGSRPVVLHAERGRCRDGRRPARPAAR